MTAPRRTDVFFFRDSKGSEPVREFVDEIRGRNPKAGTKIRSYLLRLRDLDPAGGRLASNYVKSLRNGIFELRPEWGGTEYRILFAWLPGGRLILLHGCQKRPNAITEDREIDRALRNLAEFRRREELDR